jgi:type IV secretory pathway VirB2 component (pilin)
MLLHALLAVCSFGALQEAAHVSAHEAPLVAAWTIDTATPFVGERLTLELALEGSTDFLANEVVTRTLRRLGRAVEFDTGLRPAATALLEVVGFAETTDGPTCVVDGTVVSGARLELADGRERFSVRVDVLATAPGLVQPAPRLVFAVRRARAVGVFGADVTSDYDVHELAVEAPALEVRALPAEAEGLAVGAFELVCDASDAPPAQAGDRLALVARVRGAENLEHVHVPRLESGEALHLLGVLESRSDEERVFTFEVHVVTAPTSPCEFVLETFDPTGAGRVVVLRAPLTVVFAPTADGAAAPIAPDVDLEDPGWNSMMRRMERELFGYVALTVAVVVAVLVGFMALRARRSRYSRSVAHARPRGSPRGRRARRRGRRTRRLRRNTFRGPGRRAQRRSAARTPHALRRSDGTRSPRGGAHRRCAARALRRRSPSDRAARCRRPVRGTRARGAERPSQRALTVALFATIPAVRS